MSANIKIGYSISMERIKKYRKCGKRYDYKYKCYCPSCGKDKGYLPKKSIGLLCKSCAGKISHSSISEETKEKMSKAHRGKTPWNRGLVNIYSEQAKLKMGNRWRDKQAHNKNKTMTRDQKIKLSCRNRGIKLEEFDDFTTAKNKRERIKFDYSGIRQQCFLNANYTCDLYGSKGNKINAHHLDGWHDNKDKRFNLDNLVCLSETAHKTFHNIYGNKNNTKEQYEEFKSEIETYRKTKQDLFLIAGCPGSGKSWVCDQLTSKFHYISYDGVNKNYHVYELLKNNSKQLLHDPTIKVSTFIKTYGHLFNIRLIVIVEDENIINQRMIARGGKITDTIKRRIKRMLSLSEDCEFSGTSLEVLEYLNK